MKTENNSTTEANSSDISTLDKNQNLDTPFYRINFLTFTISAPNNSEGEINAHTTS